MKRILLLLALLAGTAFGQSFNINVGGLPFRSGSSVPASCTPNGAWFFKTSTTQGWYQCIAGIYVIVGSGSGSGSVSSVGQTVNGSASSGIFTVTGSPVTTSGTLNIGLAGTSGGIPYFSSGTVVSSSGALTANTYVKGGGAGVAPSPGTTADDGAIVTFGNTGPLVKGSLGNDASLLAPTVCTPTNSAVNGSSVMCITYGPTDTASGNRSALQLNIVPQPASNSSTNFFPLTSQLNTISTTSANLAVLRAAEFQVIAAHTGNTTAIRAIEANAFTTGTAGTITDLIGVRVRSSFLSGANTPTNLYGIQVQAGGFNANPTSAITIGADRGIAIDAPNLQANGTLTLHCGLCFGGNHTGGTGNANGWAIFDATPATNKSQLGLLNVNSLTNVGASTLGTTGQTVVNASGLLTNYNGITTAGLGLPAQVARVRAVSQVAAITTTTLLTTGAANTDYLVVATLYCDTTSAAATATLTISYTDVGSQAQTITPAAAACTALGATSFALINSPIAVKTATNITYAVAIANTPTYDVRISLYQIGTN